MYLKAKVIKNVKYFHFFQHKKIKTGLSSRGDKGRELWFTPAWSTVALAVWRSSEWALGLICAFLLLFSLAIRKSQHLDGDWEALPTSAPLCHY